ncbi:DNA topoisomerase I and restriction endonuclease domain-containing protein [Azotobacter vinelandii CA]|uniref:DNA topoisomerase I and restriction endonuclease domain-containing protein n=2 Tax=Azotobacter vinelandii TaxID=354 RepID=C1DJ79_AZOVD|nr:restriction endonuclease [Azotobacter vinelandii]ACO76664.1 DNA topoisomerase I and restriction endonuclease domain-containing protein [Azotobacter vinelandii DJ]AGK15618.1 DNA topoisomerase I and restriction endonuclease domain-containing protein [Azotobacter vinelandii CA]AGK19276.1 DNA topoisomerase I and restriction endonuclease domain-containing protein [Azotobacter vinelandii CA6]SFX13304.1 restriction system protein [Azotobacter vinelandii]GLK58838.1 type II restriction endonuclease 
MPPRSRSSIAGLIRLVALLPWWLSLSAAFGAWWFLHPLAGQGALPTLDSLAGLGDPAVLEKLLQELRRDPRQALEPLVPLAAWAGQYLLPGLLGIGALLSGARRMKRGRLFRKALNNPEAISDGMDWQQFERLVGEVFRRQGYAVEETGAAGPDGGVDLIVRKGRKRYLVQCKQWRALKVGVKVVRELYGVVAAQGVAGGFVVTSGSFTEDARQFAATCDLALVDGETLQSWISMVSGRPAPEPSSRHCPLCRSPMVRRTVKRGGKAGTHFWSCSNYPDCRGTRV